MRTLKSSASDADILMAVREWIELLAEGRYRDAYDYLDHPVADSWTPELMREIIVYGGWEKTSGSSHRVTLPDTTRGGIAPRHTVVHYAGADTQPTQGFVWFDLPLDGQWSDLTAIILVMRHGNELCLSLNHITKTDPKYVPPQPRLE